ncbi:hypothetical protein ACLS0R_12965, partial [Comamonas jiangduensis]|uniref:hypothetical protein n=1 Tax=Comamonas jiangduensis TaxID=1194168 RepID=UPI003BF84298
IFNLFLGGIFYFVLTTILIIFTLSNIKKASKNTLISIWICITGLQFIPTPFSAYFLSILLCIAKVESLNHRKTI